MSDTKLAYHERLPVWPDFAFPNNEIDGLLPSCRVEDWQKFVESMRAPNHNRTKEEMVYRGQRGYKWELSSTLSRQYGGGSIPQADRDALLEQFRLAMRGRGPEFKLLDEEEIWAFGQHNGLHTPLLDWSKSPFVSLYFAFAEPDPPEETKQFYSLDGGVQTEQNTSRAVFCLDMSRLRLVMPDLFYEPATNENARLVNQAGLFTLTPSGSDNFVSAIIRELTDNDAVDFDGFEDAPTVEGESAFPVDETATRMSQYLCKIHIPNTGREECLAMLRKMNIHHGSLFPDPFGAANYSNDWLRRKIIEDRADRAAEEDAKRKADEAKAAVASTKPVAPASGTDLVDMVKAAIRATIEESAASDDTVADWAVKVVKRYDELATTDWPIRASASARIRTEITKQLSLLGTSSASRPLAEELVGIFETDYRSKHDLSFSGGSDSS